MSADRQDLRDHGFWIGLLAGAAVGAGLAMWLAPRATQELREHATESANKLRTLASDQYQKASTRAGKAVAAASNALSEMKS
jgi:gas vesicle protein